MAFVDRLEVALKERGFTPIIDRSSIYAFEAWSDRIRALIVEADTVVFVINPDAVASQVCGEEVQFAISLNKRFAPIVYRGVDDKAVPPELSRLNYIFFDDTGSFDIQADRLAEALSSDIEWVRRHTEYGALARRWADLGSAKARGLFLRSPQLEDAEKWVASRPHGAPLP